MELKAFFLRELSRLTKIPAKDLNDEGKLREIRQKILSKPVVRDQKERIGGYYNPSGLRKLITVDEIKKRRERVQKWLDSH